MKIITNHININLPGIYVIINIKTGLFYLGATIRSLFSRFYEHRMELRRNCHHNDRLQNSYNKHGESAFEVIPILNCSSNIVYSLEEKLLNILDLNYMYNTALSQYDIYNNKYHGKFIDPIGNTHKVYNMSKFCRDHNLRPSSMFDLKARRLNHVKGWSNKDSKHKPFAFISPDGILYSWIHSLTRFERMLNLSKLNWHPVWSGKLRHCQGWRRYDSQKTWPTYTAPDGTQHQYIWNSAEFARKHNLSKANLHRVLIGKYKQTKGWTYNPDNQPPLIRKEIKVGYLPKRY